jgi:hypothetical protein
MRRDAGRRTFRARIYGLDIASDIDLHAHRPPLATTPQVTVQLGLTVPAAVAAPEGALVAQWTTDAGLTATFVRRPDGSHLLRFESTCDVIIGQGADHVTVHMFRGVPDAMAGVLVSGTVLSYLLMLRGELVLHASAVDVGGRAIGFVGPSGMGKTTLATLMCRDGALLVTDDVLTTARDATSGFRCALGTTELRLRAAASALADDFVAAGSHRNTADERRALSVPATAQDDLPLAALLIPRPRRDGSPDLSLTRMSPASAVVSLLGSPRILGIRDQSMLTGPFVQMVELAERVPVFIADVPWGPPFEPDLASRLLTELDRQLGPSAGDHGCMDLDPREGARC